MSQVEIPIPNFISYTMAHSYIDDLDDLRHTLHYWKQYTLHDSYINLEDAVQSLSGRDRLVEPRPSTVSRWVVSIVKSP